MPETARTLTASLPSSTTSSAPAGTFPGLFFFPGPFLLAFLLGLLTAFLLGLLPAIRAGLLPAFLPELLPAHPLRNSTTLVPARSLQWLLASSSSHLGSSIASLSVLAFLNAGLPAASSSAVHLLAVARSDSYRKSWWRHLPPDLPGRCLAPVDALRRARFRIVTLFAPVPPSARRMLG